MLLTDLNKVQELDSRIGDMHRQLAELYQKRSTLMGGQPDNPARETLTTTPLHEQWYHNVAQDWERYAVGLPAYSRLKNKFAKAEKILGIIHQTHPEIAPHMEVIAVPPPRILKFPSNFELRAAQKLADLPDYHHPDVKPPKPEKNWRILLVYTAETSLYGGSAQKILDDKAYLLAGYDTRALGPREYTALTLQKNRLFDQNSWTVLLKAAPRKGLIAYVGYRHGRYRYDLEELDNVLDDDGFRPAIRM